MLSYLILLLLGSAVLWCDETVRVRNTDLAKEIDSRLLLFTTLDGYAYAIEQETGDVKWKVKDGAVVKVPTDVTDAIMPLYLPDPRDGSLYLIGGEKEPLKKLPFSIPELVSSSPCRSSDGILYTGKKKDTWYTLDPKTGNRQQVLGWDANGPTCPVPSPDAIYVGRSEYSIMMVDSKQANKRWNVTFYEYASVPIGKESLANYNLAHFTSSSSGLLLTIDRRASVIWEKNLGSPIVAAYILDPSGLLALPFTSVSNNTLGNFLHNGLILDSQISHLKLYPTLYIGEHQHGLYALPSYVDQSTITITNHDGIPLLLEGPEGVDSSIPVLSYVIPDQNYYMPRPNTKDTVTFQSLPQFTVIYMGHYNVPVYSKTRFQIAGSSHIMTKLLTDESSNTNKATTNEIEYEERSFNLAEELSRMFYYYKNHRLLHYTSFATLMLIPIIVIFSFRKKSTIQSEPSSNVSSTRSTHSNHAEEISDGYFQIGKIIFHPGEVLGRGCEGTSVFRGEFEGRRIAVKRIFPDSFEFGDREVALLKESDAHPNVIRYFCTEQDRNFRYIALELCQATLCEYVKEHFAKDKIKPLELLRQATLGVQHLHALNIVHRDIKPQNVLLSMAGPEGQIRAMISDFGLCKKLQVGRTSFSKKSGVTGTEGWIAPEMLHGNLRTTRAVDMFSLGCLYYYVLSDGHHPFGEFFERQANILGGKWSLKHLKGDAWRIELYKPLLISLMNENSHERPSCKAVLSYPIFWTNKTILSFLQDVSDRVEKSDNSDSVLESLECNGHLVVRGDWKRHIDDEVANDLKKYRSYRGASLRDLLRALRNKKHHFRELNQESREKLGEIPDHFTYYWTMRFPLLLVHSWLMMQCVSREGAFKQYYHSDYTYKDNLVNYGIHREETNEILATMEPEEMLTPKRYQKPKFTKKAPEKVGLYRNTDTSAYRRPTKQKNRENHVPVQGWVLPPS